MSMETYRGESGFLSARASVRLPALKSRALAGNFLFSAATWNVSRETLCLPRLFSSFFCFLVLIQRRVVLDRDDWLDPFQEPDGDASKEKGEA